MLTTYEKSKQLLVYHIRLKKFDISEIHKFTTIALKSEHFHILEYLHNHYIQIEYQPKSNLPVSIYHDVNMNWLESALDTMEISTFYAYSYIPQNVLCKLKNILELFTINDNIKNCKYFSKTLHVLTLVNYSNVNNIISQITNLQELNIFNSKNVKKINNSIKILKISNTFIDDSIFKNSLIKELELESLSINSINIGISLTKLTLININNLPKNCLDECINIRKLTLINTELKTLKPFQDSLEELTIHDSVVNYQIDCKYLIKLDYNGNMLVNLYNNIEELYVYKNSNLNVEKCKTVKKLYLEKEISIECYNVILLHLNNIKVDIITKCRNIKELYLENCDIDIKILPSSLELININNCIYRYFDFMENCINISELVLKGLAFLPKITFTPKLKIFHIDVELPYLDNSFLNCTSLLEFYFTHAYNIDFDNIPKSVMVLCIIDNYTLENIDDYIPKFKNLSELYLYTTNKVLTCLKNNSLKIFKSTYKYDFKCPKLLLYDIENFYDCKKIKF